MIFPKGWNLVGNGFQTIEKSGLADKFHAVGFPDIGNQSGGQLDGIAQTGVVHALVVNIVEIVFQGLEKRPHERGIGVGGASA